MTENVAPEFAAASVTVIDVNENDTVVYTPQATDSDALTYTLGGPDADKFVINGDGSVSFVTAPDFEAPGSAAGTNSYSFSVTASDGTLSDVQAVTVNVADVTENVAPEFAAPTVTVTVDENDTVVYTPQATDSDALTYTLGGPDADKFVINGDGSVSFVTAPDFEAPGSAAGTNSYSFSVTASDGTLSDVQAVTVNVADVAEITYDNLTLDFDAVGDVNSDWAFGGASASQTTYDSVGVLSFTHPVGAESWAGATIAKGYGETDFIADRGSVTARVWSDTTGTVRLAMEDTSSIPPNAGATRFIADTQSVTGGQWNDLTFNFPAGNAVGSEADTNYNQLVINTDEGNTVYVDQIVMAGADVIPAPADPMTEGPTAPTAAAADVVSLYSDTYTEEAGNFRTDWSLG